MNKDPKAKVIVVAGPTASGKSALAVEIARMFRGEVVSADSRQIYRNLDIGTGKATKREQKGIRHHLLDVTNPKHTMSVAQYERLATKSIADILARAKIPIICGGTGFYIDAILTTNSFPPVSPNKKFREKLAAKTPEKLFSMLKKLDSERAKNIDKKNPSRLIRAIEIAKALGKVPKQTEVKPRYNILYIGLFLPREKLKERISVRLATRMRRGMVAEARRLHRSGLSWKRMEELGLEYRFMARFFQNKTSKEEMLRGLDCAIGKYAKRQMTWFKRNKNIEWFDPEKPEEIMRAVNLFLKT